LEVSLKKFSWTDIYGSRKIEKRSEKGELLQSVFITLDGEHILPLKSISMQYLNEKGEYLSRSLILPANELYEPLSMEESIFTTGASLSEFTTITLDDFFYLEIDSTYILDSEDNLDGLLDLTKSLLKQKKLLAFSYAYYKTAFPKTAVLVPVEKKIVVFIGESFQPIFIGQDSKLEEILEIEVSEEDAFGFEEVW
jgi:hypothetical protein